MSEQLMIEMSLNWYRQHEQEHAQEIARLRELLADITELNPYRFIGFTCHFCEGWPDHKPDCPWLQARQWLEEHPE